VKRWLFVAGLFIAPAAACAQDFSLNGMADFRLVAPSGQDSNLDGGFGKLRWGDGRGSPVIPDLGGLVLRGSAAPFPDLRIVVELRYDPRQKTAIDVIDAYARWRPVSTTRWRWSVKAGAFFPPVSLENTQIGWLPEWTITPSAINSWVGEELRTIGAEAMLEWRGDEDYFEFVVAAFGVNEPAGAAIASYGWTFNDRATGLFDHVRLPNAFSPNGAPQYSYEFRQFDHAVGWYAGIAWERPEIGRVMLLRYDNDSDPNAHDATEYGWRTKFWSLSGSTQLGPVIVLAQAMVGRTTIEPFAGMTVATDFWAWYVLGGIERGDWRFALRFDQFGTNQTMPGPGPKGDEHGVAGTAAVTWSPRKWLSVMGEILAVDYTNAQRVLVGEAPHVTELQAQLAVRVSF
jgi:hypothetical protein